MRGGIGQRPPAPCGGDVRFKRGMGAQERMRGENRLRRRRCKPRGDRQVGLRRHDEQPRPRLRQEMRGVDRQRAEDIAQPPQDAADLGKVAAAVRRQRADDILDDDQARRPALGVQSRHQGVKTPERARARARQPRAGAGERQVLAGKRRPGEIGAPRQVVGAELGDVGDPQRLAAPVRGVTRRLLRIDVIGEEASPVGAETCARHAAAAEKFIKTGSVHRARVASSRERRSFCA